MKKYSIEKFNLIENGEGYFKVKISQYGITEIPCYEIFLFLQEYQPKLYEYAKKFKNNYILMFKDIEEIGVNIVPILHTYLNDIISYRIERDIVRYNKI